MIICKIMSEKLLSLLVILNLNFLWDETSKRVNKRSISNFTIILTVSSIPFVAVDFEKSFHQKLWPYLVDVCCSWKNWHALVTAWHSVIYLDKSLLTHEPELDPVLTGWRNSWDTILLWVNSLPNSLIGVNIPDCSISDELELGSHPLSVLGHQKVHVQATINWDLD